MKISLSLAGGGVRGAAHIGVIKALEENKIEISAIAGTSIGSIVASLYAMGYTADEMLKLFKFFSKEMLRADPKYLMNNIRSTKSILGSGIISGQAIEDAMQECAKLKGMKNIQDIQIPIAIPAVDIKTGKEVVFTNRKFDKQEYLSQTLENRNIKYINNIEIGKAVRASSSYPGVFSPLTYKEYRLVDGGVLDNVPTSELKKITKDKILTVKFPPREAENPRTAINILSRCMDIVFDERDTRTTKVSDYVLNIDVTSSSTFDIKKIDSCYEEGYQRAFLEMEKIKENMK